MDDPRWRTAAVIVLVAALALVTLTAGHYGYNVDEWVQTLHGIALADWYRDLLRTHEYRPFSAELEAMNYYGGSFELPAELLSRISPGGRTATRHLLTAWVAILGLAGAYLLGRTVHSRAAGFVTVVLLLLTPGFYGHFFSNPKDLPFAVATVWALFLICRALPLLPRLGAGRILGLGAVIGLGLGLRVGAVVLLFYFAMALAWWLGAEALRRRRLPAGADLLALARSAAGVLLAAWLVMLLFWPWAQASPLAGPLRAARFYGNLAEYEIDFDVFFEGRDFALHTVPRRFTLEQFLISMPEFALLAPLALAPLALWFRSRRLGWPDPRAMSWLLVGCSVALPLATTASRAVVQYDGTRHFLFVMPSLALILAAGFVSTLAGPASGRLKAALVAAAAGLALVTAIDMVRLHPYEYVYYNRSVAGGVARAAERFETDYLGLSYREAVRWVQAHYPTRAGRPVRITSCPGFHPNLVDALAGDERFVPVSPYDPSEVAVVGTRDHCPERFRGRALATISRVGTPLAHVIQAP